MPKAVGRGASHHVNRDSWLRFWSFPLAAGLSLLFLGICWFSALTIYQACHRPGRCTDLVFQSTVDSSVWVVAATSALAALTAYIAGRKAGQHRNRSASRDN